LNHVIASIDFSSAYAFNSIVGAKKFFDLSLAMFSTKFGDMFVLGCVATLIAVHCLRGTTLKEAAKRISFWVYFGTWCVGSYLLVCCLVAEQLAPRATPITLLHLHNVQEMYKIKLRSSAMHSFPSGHALAYLLFSLASFNKYRFMSLLFAAIGIVMLAVRLILGLHWVSDMLLGSLPLALVVLALAAQPLSVKCLEILNRVVSYTVTELAKAGCPILRYKRQN